MLNAKNLSKKYGQLTVLDDVSLEIPKGQVVSIVGPSGAGKSTLLHLLGGIDKPDKGEVFISDTNLFQLNPKALARFRNQNLGFVFQFHHLLPEFSAVENVAIPSWLGGQSKKEGEELAKSMLKLVGLETKFLQKPSELSGGEQQRVAIARALINQPSLVLADEPTGNLDSANASLIHELFISTSKTFGHTIVFVTHNEELSFQTDRTLHMLDGKIVDDQHR